MNNRFIEPVLTELSEPTNFFFEQTPELDAATGVIGHLRIDFGRNGKQFLHTWKQRGKAELNTPIGTPFPLGMECFMRSVGIWKRQRRFLR